MLSRLPCRHTCHARVVDSTCGGLINNLLRAAVTVALHEQMQYCLLPPTDCRCDTVRSQNEHVRADVSVPQSRAQSTVWNKLVFFSNQLLRTLRKSQLRTLQVLQTPLPVLRKAVVHSLHRFPCLLKHVESMPIKSHVYQTQPSQASIHTAEKATMALATFKVGRAKHGHART